ncbi:Lrp/AsnC family transcriptional regulator [Zhihengliuella flava]|uniref:DNA-binding Lrp family transcriptional regulator n=1 Tax=Zhihengliuella flava TaxID=1285193 RepID=A0A931D694_9MICC|nr:DNA-binding Lrp family transcriptional regulator [Zhihengliuella flava]
MGSTANDVRSEPVELDEIDKKLLRMLAENARRTNNSMAAELAIAPSTCLARVNRLRETGVIRRYTVDVNPERIGRALQALIFVRIRPGARHTMSTFSSEIRGLRGVTQLFFLGGTDDFVIHLAVRDSHDVRQFVLDHLSANPAVASTQTSLVFDHLPGGPWV